VSCRVFIRVAAALFLNALWGSVSLAGESVPAGYASAARAHGVPADIFYAIALTHLCHRLMQHPY
jgi:hypothetical protein